MSQSILNEEKWLRPFSKMAWCIRKCSFPRGNGSPSLNPSLLLSSIHPENPWMISNDPILVCFGDLHVLGRVMEEQFPQARVFIVLELEQRSYLGHANPHCGRL